MCALPRGRKRWQENRPKKRTKETKIRRYRQELNSAKSAGDRRFKKNRKTKSKQKQISIKLKDSFLKNGKIGKN